MDVNSYEYRDALKEHRQRLRERTPIMVEAKLSKASRQKAAAKAARRARRKNR